MLMLILLICIVLTLVVAPCVLMLFRRQVTASMNQSAQAGTASVVIGPSLPLTLARTQPLVPRVRSDTPLADDPKAQALSQQSTAKLRRIAKAYACAGLAQAAVMTLVVLQATSGSGTGTAVLAFFAVLSLPVVPTVGLVLATRLRTRLLWAVGAWLLVVALAGDARGLVLDVTKLYVLAPAVCFLILNLRHWRAATPVVMAITLGGSVGWLLLFELGKAAGVDGLLMWVFRLLGLALGVGMALPLARRMGAYYQAKKSSELMLFIDLWWGLLTVIQTSILVAIDRGPAWPAWLAYVAFWWVSRHLMAGLRDESPPQARLLLLRVFGHDLRTERLLDELSLRWRPLGTVELIAGRDLAYRNVDPAELYGFLTGDLSREFVKDPQHLAQRLSQRDERQDPDGLYRVSSYYCHQDTWKPTLDTLAAGCNAVLMDLRGFGVAHSGCQYEITKLAEHLGSKPIVLLVDKPEVAELAERVLVQALPVNQRDKGMADQSVYFLQVDEALGGTVDTAIQLLLGRQPA
jgi:hypothetical protein